MDLRLILFLIVVCVTSLNFIVFYVLYKFGIIRKIKKYVGNTKNNEKE